MLEHVGKLNAHLHLVDTTGAITSEPFTIVVFEGVDVDAMASDDELSALTQALVQVNNLETTYAPRLNSIESSVDSLTDDAALNKSNIVSNTQDIVNLDGRLTTVEQNIDEHLAESANKHITESGTNENGSYIRYDDGTQICTGRVSTGGLTKDTYNSIPITMPASFSNILYSVAPNLQRQGGTRADLNIVSITTNSFSVQIYPYSIGFDWGTFSYIVIGRWK